MDGLALALNYLLKSREPEYRTILTEALQSGYNCASVAQAAEAFKTGAEKVLICRHDVDDVSPGLQMMSDIEESLNIKSTYYFRWSTANPVDVERTIRSGHEVSLHYETLATYADANGISDAGNIPKDAWARCADLLAEEVSTFRQRFGCECKTIASHGARTNIIMGVGNAEIFKRVQGLHQRLGIDLEVYDPSFLSEIDLHISDTQWGINDGYRYGTPPLKAIRSGTSRISFLTHPNHWGFSPKVKARRMIKHLLRGRQRDTIPFAYADSLRNHSDRGTPP